MQKDLSLAAGRPVEVNLYNLAKDDIPPHLYTSSHKIPGESLDLFDIKIDHYNLTEGPLKHDPHLDPHSEEIVSETLYSHLLKSNCLVTGQPDWGSLTIRYQRKKIDRESLIKYIVSYRQHNEFHEQCVERIFIDIKNNLKPEKLSVYARYTRRGGLDINPFRSDFEERPPIEFRLLRQ